MADTGERGDLLSVLEAHDVTEPSAWAAALELEVDRQRGSALDRLIDRHGDRLIDLAGAVVIGGAAAGADPVGPIGLAATDGGVTQRHRPRGSPQRRKFVEGAEGGREPAGGRGASDRSAREPDRLSGESEPATEGHR